MTHPQSRPAPRPSEDAGETHFSSTIFATGYSVAELTRIYTTKKRGLLVAVWLVWAAMILVSLNLLLGPATVSRMVQAILREGLLLALSTLLTHLALRCEFRLWQLRTHRFHTFSRFMREPGNRKNLWRWRTHP